MSSLHGNKYLAEAQKSWPHPYLEHCRRNPLPTAPVLLACPILDAPPTSFHLCLGDTSLGASGHKDLLRAATSLGTQRPCEQSPAPISEMPFAVFECSGWPEPAPFPCYHGNGCLENMCNGCTEQQSPAKQRPLWPVQSWHGHPSALPPAAKELNLRPKHVAGVGHGGNATCLPLFLVSISPCPVSSVQLSPQLQECGRELLAIHLCIEILLFFFYFFLMSPYCNN